MLLEIEQCKTKFISDITVADLGGPCTVSLTVISGHLHSCGRIAPSDRRGAVRMSAEACKCTSPNTLLRKLFFDQVFWSMVWMYLHLFMGKVIQLVWGYYLAGQKECPDFHSSLFKLQSLSYGIGIIMLCHISVSKPITSSSYNSLLALKSKFKWHRPADVTTVQVFKHDLSLVEHESDRLAGHTNVKYTTFPA